LTIGSSLALLGIALVSWGSLETPVYDVGALVLTIGLLAVGVLCGDTGREERDQLVRLPGFFVWLYLYHRQAGVLIEELGLPTYERALSAADHRLFGGDLSVLAQSVYSPGFTELIQWAYSLYYVVLLGLPIALLMQRRAAAVRHVLGTLALAHTALVATNMLIPARWPVLLYQDPALADLITYPFPMEGLWATGWLRGSIEGGTRMLWDSMPSGHTCVTLLMLLMTRALLPRFLWVLVPLSFGLVFGTVYLRYHYGVDLLAGATLALVLHALSPRLQRAWDGVSAVDSTRQALLTASPPPAPRKEP